MTAQTLFLVNGGATSAAAERARRVAAALDGDRSTLLYRRAGRVADAARFASVAARAGFDSLYAMELAVVPVVAGAINSSRKALIVDTGDSPAAFLELVSAGAARVLAARRLERLAYSRADQIIVRSHNHERMLCRQGYENVAVVPDGVDLTIFRPIEDQVLRRGLRLDQVFTVGIQGHFTWYPSMGGGLGGELVKAIALRKDLPIHAVLIGDGVGVPELRQLAVRLGVADRLHVIGTVPYRELPRYLGICDVCLLTQTNDPSSWIRTTGKLPGYLATGRYILASRVGPVATMLPEEMLVDYHGYWDEEYPRRLAERIATVMADPRRVQKGLDLRPLADQFEYANGARLAAEVVRATRVKGR